MAKSAMTSVFVHSILFLTRATICLYRENFVSAWSSVIPTNAAYIIQQKNQENNITTYCHTVRYDTCKETNFSYLICPASEDGKNNPDYSCPILFEIEEKFAICTNKTLTSIDEMRIPENTTVLCLQYINISKIGPESFKIPKLNI